MIEIIGIKTREENLGGTGELPCETQQKLREQFFRTDGDRGRNRGSGRQVRTHFLKE